MHKQWVVLLMTLTSLVMSCDITAHQPKARNVLLISIDDLNDWVGCLQGHPQARTPNLDALAQQGTLFAQAYCQAPVCQPSRSSLMTSRYPSSTGLYFLNPGIKQSPVTKNALTLTERFAKEGYKVMGVGKLYHSSENKTIFTQVGEWGGDFGRFGPLPTKKFVDVEPRNSRLWDWGPYPERIEDKPDFKIKEWAKAKLQQKHDKPFFLAVGFMRPHVPLYAPQKYFDMFPLNTITLPERQRDDLSDIPEYGKKLSSLKHISPVREWMEKKQQEKKAVQAYLAAIAFVDDMIGDLLKALRESEYHHNTMVLLFSDHGFHMGEKDHWAKRTLWEDGLRVPLMVSGPGLPEAQVCRQAVGLIDIYPTLLDLMGLRVDPQHEGQSLKPLLHDPQRKWVVPVRSTFGPGNHSLRSQRYRYIRYLDGSEELYDHRTDPHEWHNLARDKKFEDVIRKFKQHLPTREHAILGKNSTGHKCYEASLPRK